MADLTINPSEVGTDRPVPTWEPFLAGENLVPGQVVYQDRLTRKWSLTTITNLQENAVVWGVTLGEAALNQACPVARGGTIILGPSAGVVPGVIYAPSATKGNIAPITDLTTSGWWVPIIGQGGQNGELHLIPFSALEQVP